MQKNEIYVIQGKEYKAMTLQILEKSRLEELIPAKDACIGIKPNLVSPSPASYGATTHPEVVKGIVEYLQQVSKSCHPGRLLGGRPDSGGCKSMRI